MSTTNSFKKKLFAALLCIGFAFALMPAAALSYAANTEWSPYYYNISGQGIKYSNDHRAKTTSSYVGVWPSTVDYYVTPCAYNPVSASNIPMGTQTWVDWTGYEKNISNYINENGYNYASLKFEGYYNRSVHIEGWWRPDNGNY